MNKWPKVNTMKSFKITQTLYKLSTSFLKNKIEAIGYENDLWRTSIILFLIMGSYKWWIRKASWMLDPLKIKLHMQLRECGWLSEAKIAQ